MKKFSFAPPPTTIVNSTVADVAAKPATTRTDGLIRRTRGISLKGLLLDKWYDATCTGKAKEKLNKNEGWYEWLVQVNVDGQLYFLAANDDMSDKLDAKQSVTNCTFKFFLYDIKDSDVKWANPLEYIEVKLP